jgi:hypothetical protein
MITSNHSGITGTSTLGYSQETINGGIGVFTSPNNTVLTTTSNGSNYTSLSQAITNSNNMVRQTKVAVFTVERNEDNKIISTTFIKELWVELKNETSLDLAVAKQLDKDYDPANTVIKQIYSVTF